MDEMEDPKLFGEVEKILRENKKRTEYLKKLKTALLHKYPDHRLDFNLIVMRLHNWIEDIFDRILRSYLRPRQKDEYLYDDDIIKALEVKLTALILFKKRIFYTDCSHYPSLRDI